MGFYEKIKAKIVFFLGDLRKTESFPWFGWGVHRHKIDYDEICEVLPRIQYGDVGLHRDAGYFSNICIPGFMKHAWLHVHDGLDKPQIIEAVSEGVIKRSALYPLFSDYAIILSPKEVNAEQRKGACKKAESVVGAQYDINFSFNIDEELAFYEGGDMKGAVQDLEKAQEALRGYDYAFSCTEMVSYAWWHLREQLRLFKKVRRGHHCILADDFLNHRWEIKWLSSSVTVEVAQKYGLHEEGIEMIRAYREKFLNL